MDRPLRATGSFRVAGLRPTLLDPLTGLARPAGNELEIGAINLWPNRMIGDEQLPSGLLAP